MNDIIVSAVLFIGGAIVICNIGIFTYWFITRNDQPGKAVLAPVYTTVSLSIMFAGFALSSFVAYAFVGILLEKMFDLNLLTLVWIVGSIGLIIWSIVVFRTNMLRWWFIMNEPLEAVVVGSLLSRDRVLPETNEGPLGNFDTSALREIGPGWHGKLPWEVPIGPKINLQAGILIGNDADDPLEVRSSDGIPVLVHWLTRLSALRGWLVNLVQYEDEAQIKEFRNKFVKFLLGWASKKTVDQIFKSLTVEEEESLERDFNRLLSGKDVLDPFEKERGMRSGDPQFGAFLYHPKYSEALQAPNIMDRIGSGIKQLTEKAFGDNKEALAKINPNILLMMSASAAGALGDTRPIILVGGEGLGDKGIAAMQALAIKDSKPDKKGK